MIIKKCWYKCDKCCKSQFFEVDESFSTKCPYCDEEMRFVDYFDCDTEEVERRKNAPKVTIVKDGSRYRPLIKCPTCSSSNVKSISSTSRIFSASLFGLGSNKINKSFECKTCGYTW